MKHMPLYLVLRGGLGNQLFMFASVYSEAKRTKRKLQLITNWYEEQKWDGIIKPNRRFFELDEFPKIRFINSILTAKISMLLYLVFKFTWKFGEKMLFHVCANLDTREKPITHYWPLLVHGYMQNQKNFEMNRSELIEIFSIDNELELTDAAYLESIKTKNKRLIALHIRRGDNAKKHGPEYRLSLNYYEECLRKLDYKLNTVVVFSDEIDWCKKRFYGRGFYFINEMSPVRSLLMLSKCDDYILSVSTFSWWGAWLSESIDKSVLVPKLPLLDSSWNNLSDKNWIQVEADFDQSMQF